MKFTKFVLVFVLTLTLVFGSSLAVYAFDLVPAVSVNIPGAGTVTGEVDENDIAHLTVIPNEGYRFIRWQIIEEVDGVDTWTHLSYALEYDFLLEDDAEIRAYFDSVVNLTVTINGVGTYTMLNVNNNNLPHYGYHLPGEYLPGETMLTTPEAGEGYHFVNWVYNGISSNVVPFTFIMPDEDTEIIFNFAPDVIAEDEYMVTGMIAPVDTGTIDGLGVYTVDDEVILTAMPESGYIFVDWDYDSEVITPTIDGDEMTFMMPEENVVVTANFIADTSIMATIKYVNTSDVSIQADTQVAIPLGPYTQTAPAISGYQHVYSSPNHVGTVMEGDEAFVITHVYQVPPTPQVITNTVTETVFVTVPATTEATTEPVTEVITEEEPPLGPPIDLDLIYDVPEIIGEDPMPTTEETDEVVLDEDVPLAGHLPATGQLPSEMFFGIGGLISAAGLWLKRRK